MAKYEGIEGIEFLTKVLEEFMLKVEIEGLDNLPDNGKCFFVSNHPFGLIDGLILTHTVGQRYHSLKAIGNDMFDYVPNLRPLIATVNVFGRISKEGVLALEEVYNSQTPITHFPEGEVSRRHNGKIHDISWQKSFVSKAVSCQRNIVPFFIYGKNSSLFYFIYSTRKLLGIKTDIELMLLPHEMFRKRGQTVRVRIGKPIYWQTFDQSLTHKEWAEKLRQHVYLLGEAPTSDLEFKKPFTE